MIDYKDIEQKSIEWHELKWGKIGGTASKYLLTDKNETLYIDLLGQKLEDFEPTDSYENEAMQRGNELEPFAREYISTYVGVEFLETGWLQSEENELLGISPDGITEDYKQSCEIKCLGRKAHYDILIENEIPLDKIPQCIHYFTVNPDLEKHYFIAFRPEAPKHFIKELTRDSIVNIGTKAKPIKKTISECVEIARKNADKLLEKINKQKLAFNDF